MNDSVLRFIRKYRMVSPGDKVICALSGGKDSMDLLHILLELQDTLGITVTAAHFNHHLRGAESLRDQQFVQEHCRSCHVPLTVGGADVAAYAAAHKLGIEEAARQLRYAFLEHLSPDAKIATAHQAQDNLETMLMHLVRGCRLHGLSGIAPVRGRIIRPLLCTEPAELLSYLEARGIPHVEDSTNQEDDSLRNRLRHNVIPQLLSENPSLLEAASSLCLSLGQEDAYLEAQAHAQLAQLQTEHGLSCAGLCGLPEAMALRVLRLYLNPVPSLSAHHLSQGLLLAGSKSPSAAYALPGGYVLRRVYEYLSLDAASAPSVPPACALCPGDSIGFGPYRISCEAAACPSPLSQGQLILSAEGLSFPLTVRSRQPGDRIRLPGGSKKISRLMIDLKIPAAARNTLPLIVQDQEVLALPPYLAAADRRPTTGSSSLILTVKRMEEEP